jgi:hypothetical protein
VNFHAYRPAIPLASPRKPLAHGLGQSLGYDAESGFQRAISGRQGIVEFGFSGKIAHAEAIEPIEGAGPPLLIHYNVDEKFLRVDFVSISS